MKLKAELEGDEYALSISIDGERLAAEVDGRRYELEIRTRSEGRYLLIEGTRIFDCRIEQSRETFTVQSRHNRYPIRIIDPKRLRSIDSGTRHDHGSVEIVAPMPGKVVRVLVKPGTEVTAGTSILVVEAMKMQNELKTSRTGTVTSIYAEPGATVNAGDVLAVID